MEIEKPILFFWGFWVALHPLIVESHHPDISRRDDQEDVHPQVQKTTARSNS